METNLIKLSVISLLNFLSIGLLIPVVTPRLRQLGASYAVIGTSNGIRDIVNVLAGPVVGSWSDLQGTKYVIFITLVIAGLCRLLIGLTTSLAAVFTLNLIIALFDHTPILNKALISDVLPQEKQGRAFTTNSITFSLGIIFGPIIGGYLNEEKHGFFYICVLITIGYLMIIGVTQTFPEKKKVTLKKEEPTNLKNAFLNIFVELYEVDWKTFGDVFLLRFLLGFSVMSYFTNQIAYFYDQYNVSPKSVGYIIAVIGILGIIATISLSYIKSTFYRNDLKSSKFLFHQFIILSISLLLAYLLSNLNILIGVLVSVSLVNSMLSFVTMQVLSQRGTDATRGSVTAVSESVMSMGSSLGHLSSGIVASYFGTKNVFLIAHLSSLLGVFVCFNLNREKNLLKKE